MPIAVRRSPRSDLSSWSSSAWSHSSTSVAASRMHLSTKLRNTYQREREFFIDNLLVRIHFIIEIIWWTGLAPWEFEFPFPGSLISTFLVQLSSPTCPVSCRTFHATGLTASSFDAFTGKPVRCLVELSTPQDSRHPLSTRLQVNLLNSKVTCVRFHADKVSVALDPVRSAMDAQHGRESHVV